MQREPDRELQLGQFIPLHYHYVMLQDKLRMDGFQSAIEQLVRPGARVLELGGGTGVLSFFAARCGAKVTCVERNPKLVDTARRLLEANGAEGRVNVVQDDAMEYVPEEPVDFVICEMLHVAMLRERQLDVIAAFKENYQKAFGVGSPLPRFIPEASVLMVQAVEQDFDFNGYRAAVPLFQSLDREHESTTRSLTELAPYSLISYDEIFPTQFDVSHQFTVEYSGTMTALRFVTQNILSVDVEAQSAISWPNQALILPIEPISVSKGDNLGVQCQYRSGDSLEQLAATLRVHAVPTPASRKAA